MKTPDRDILNKLVGIPWKEDGRSFEGTDCVGLMQLYFNSRGMEGVAPKAGDYESLDPDEVIFKIREYNYIIPKDEIQPEDVLVFKIDDELHVGLYLGYGRMLHATEGKKSKISRLTPSWETCFLFAIREKDGRIYIPPAGPPAIIAAVAFVGAMALGPSLGMAFGTTLLFAIGLAVTGYSMGLAIQSRQQSKSGGLAASPRYRFGELQTTSTNQYPVPLLYGEARLAGNIVYQNPVMGGENIDLLVALCQGEIDSITDIRINGEPIGDLPGCSYHAFLGTPTQNVETDSGLDLEGIQYRHTAMLHLHLSTSDKLKGGRPNVTCVVRGRKVSTWTGSDWSVAKSYSDNPAACIRDYLLMKMQAGGCGYFTDDVDDMSFGEVYDRCLELVSNGAGGSERRYAMSFCIDQKRAATDNLAEMLVGFAGALIRSGSKLKLLVAKPSASVASLNEDDIRDLKVIQKGLDQKINRFGIEYFDPEQDDARILAWGQEDKIDQDERGLVEQTLTIPSINRQSQALRLSNQYFYELKLCPIMIEFTTSLNAIGQEIGDCIKITHSLMGWVDKEFIIQRIEEDEKDVFKFVCQEYNASIYNDRYGATIQVFDYGTPPNPYKPVSDVSNIVLQESPYYLHRDGTVGSDILISFDPPTDDSKIFLSHYQVELKKGAADYKTIGFTSGSNFTVYSVEADTTYLVRIKTVSINSVISDGIVSDPLTVLGKLAAPSNVTGFEIYQEGNLLKFSWNAISDADLARYIIKKGSEWGVGQVIAELIDTTEFMYPVGETGEITFMIKAIDTSGNESAAPGIDTLMIVPPPEMNFINTFDPWSVNHEYRLSNLALIRRNDYDTGYVRNVFGLLTQNLWEDREAEGKTWEEQEADLGLILDEPVRPSGYYEMVTPLDLETIFEFKIFTDVLYKNVTGGSLAVEISLSEDGVSYTAFTAINANATYRARYVKFKFTLSASDVNHNVYFYACSIFINAPSVRVAWAKDVLIPIAGKTIIFGAGFSFPPRVNTAIVNGVKGIIILSGKTKDQMDAQVYDLAGAPIGTAEIDWEAKGY
ncbi:MAG: NlpC/P60 family protein [Candidatus Omnitrophica bacterium]|nr:NlpC/P60 family protein [Candidatus Omnitrophota bacterium]